MPSVSKGSAVIHMEGVQEDSSLAEPLNSQSTAQKLLSPLPQSPVFYR